MIGHDAAMPLTLLRLDDVESNPTANEIHRAIGHEPVIDVDLYHFEADA